MASHNAPMQEPAIFAAVLTPHCSLSRHGFRLLMTALTAISFASGMAFVLMGAWPVFGFFGLDVLLLYAALELSYRRARAYEQVTVTAS